MSTDGLPNVEFVVYCSHIPVCFRKDELGVMQLSLIAVRRRYRRRGLGRRLINVI